MFWDLRLPATKRNNNSDVWRDRGDYRRKSGLSYREHIDAYNIPYAHPVKRLPTGGNRLQTHHGSHNF